MLLVFLKNFQSEATLSQASTWMGDRLGTPGAVDFLIFFQTLGPVQIQLGEECKNQLLHGKGQSQTLYEKGKCHES